MVCLCEWKRAGWTAKEEMCRMYLFRFFLQLQYPLQVVGDLSVTCSGRHFSLVRYWLVPSFIMSSRFNLKNIMPNEATFGYFWNRRWIRWAADTDVSLHQTIELLRKVVIGVQSYGVIGLGLNVLCATPFTRSLSVIGFDSLGYGFIRKTWRDGILHVLRICIKRPLKHIVCPEEQKSNFLCVCVIDLFH